MNCSYYLKEVYDTVIILNEDKNNNIFEIKCDNECVKGTYFCYKHLFDEKELIQTYNKYVKQILNDFKKNCYCASLIINVKEYIYLLSLKKIIKNILNKYINEKYVVDIIIEEYLYPFNFIYKFDNNQTKKCSIVYTFDDGMSYLYFNYELMEKNN